MTVRVPNSERVLNSDREPVDNAANDLKADRLKRTEDRKAAFEIDQKARAEAFERDQVAQQRKAERLEEIRERKAEMAEAIANANRENDEAAIRDGLLTHADLIRRRELLAPYHGCLLPHEALAEGEPTVKMAFPKSVVLTHSAADIMRLMRDNRPDLEGAGPITHGSRVIFYKGYQDVPVSVADHQYLYDNGAYRVDSDGKPESEEARIERMREAKNKNKAKENA